MLNCPDQSRLIRVLFCFVILFMCFYLFYVPENHDIKASYFQMLGSSENTTISNGIQMLTFDKLSYSNDKDFKIKNSSTVVINTIGTYKVTYRIQFESHTNDGGDISTFSGMLFLNDDELSGSRSSCFLTKHPNNSISSGCGNSIIIEVKEISELYLGYTRSHGTTSARIRPRHSSVLIEKL